MKRDHYWEDLWEDYPKHQYCIDCGLIKSGAVRTLSCPPWGFSQRGETPQPDSQFEVGVLKRLRKTISNVSKLLNDLEIFHKRLYYAETKNIIDDLNQIIKTLEGQGKR